MVNSLFFGFCACEFNEFLSFEKKVSGAPEPDS